MASIRASVDTMLSSPDYRLLQDEGAKVEKAMSQTKGIVSVLKTWDMDKVVYNLDIDEQQAMEYGVNRSDITSQLQMMLRGVPVATFPKANSIDYTVRVWLLQKQIDDFSTILNTLIVTPKGKIPLSKIAKQKQFKASAERMVGAIIVNNAILLIHFALEQIKEGMNKREAMLESIKIRTRPVLMTAFAVSVGMLPVAQGTAIGLERLAPLGAVAIGGLVIGTLMTLIFIPVGFVWLVGEKSVVEE